MTISEKSGFKKNQYIHFATLTASLALGHVSGVSTDTEYVSSKARFFSVENYDYSVDCDIEKGFGALEPGGSR